MKNIKLIIAISVLVGITFFISCDSRTFDELKPPVAPGDVTYNNDIKPILDSKCISCHKDAQTTGTFPDLDTYQNVKDYELNNGVNGYTNGGTSQTQPSLLCSVQASHCTESQMPKGDSPLSNTSITTIQNWIDNGYREY
ncbi:MAG: hypothetical protein NT048_00875 [Flavobacterium sp.]|nr:hypothetical protein [Flavobacterium sp.]